MKKTLLIGGLMLSAWLTQAQQRLALYEEFSGENCGPCAALNPALNTLLAQPGNDAKILLLKYQSPIPSAGPIYNANTVFTDARMDYYSIPFAPHGSINGADVGSGANQGNINQTTQAMIDAASSGTAAFTVTVGTPSYQNGGQSFTATITVKATAATNIANLKLRVALVESLHYTSAPGTNGETDFHNVVRQMYGTTGPNPDGQTMQAAWTANQTVTYTVTGAVPSYAGLNPAIPAVNFIAAWVQRDDTKEVLQVGKTGNITLQKPPLDVALTAITGVSGLMCQVPAAITPTITVKNVGTTALTSARVYGPNGTTQDLTFSPAIAAGATKNVTLNTVNITTAGVQSIVDSIALPNGTANIDYNSYDNSVSGVAYILNSTPSALPLSYDVEAVNANWVGYPGTSGNAYPIVRVSATTDGTTYFGYDGSHTCLWYPNAQLGAGYSGYYIMPKADLPAGAKKLEFYASYALRDGAGDKLEVVYTTDCGANWTQVWTKSNGDLANATATTGTTLHIPSGGNAGWKKWGVDISSVPTGAYLAFKATSGGANNLFIDNINIATGAVVGIDELVAQGSFNVYPNPASDLLNMTIDLKKASSVTYTVFNVLGQQVNAPVTKAMNAGTNTATININNLAAGMYYLNIATEAGSIQQKFTKQ